MKKSNVLVSVVSVMLVTIISLNVYSFTMTELHKAEVIYRAQSDCVAEMVNAGIERSSIGTSVIIENGVTTGTCTRTK